MIIPVTAGYQLAEGLVGTGLVVTGVACVTVVGGGFGGGFGADSKRRTTGLALCFGWAADSCGAGPTGEWGLGERQRVSDGSGRRERVSGAAPRRGVGFCRAAASQKPLRGGRLAGGRA